MDGGAPLQDYAASAPTVAEQLRLHHPVRTAAAFAALLLDPAMQGSALRLEALTHLSLAHGATGQDPSPAMLTQVFADLGAGSLAQAETHSEQLFVGLVRTIRGGFRVLEGNWAGQSFHLQRIVNVVEAMPAGNPYDLLRDSVFALLALSDLVCARAGLRRYTPGQFEPLAVLPAEAAERALDNPGLVTFDAGDLAALGIDREALEPFVFDLEYRRELLRHDWGDTPLEGFPLVAGDDAIHLVLPTAVSLAIRRMVIAQLLDWDFKAELVSALGREFKAWFGDLRTVGGGSAKDLRFQFGHGGGVASLGVQIDAGRFLQFVFVLDDLEGFESGRFARPRPASGDPVAAIEALIGVAHKQAMTTGDYRQGLTLVVHCGVGRPTVAAPPQVMPDGWRAELINAPDLESLTRLRRFDPLLLWRLLDARDKIAAQGARFYLEGGLAQLVGQARSLEGHLLEHGDFEDACLDGDRMLVVRGDPYAMLRIRHEAAENWDPHVVEDFAGRPIQVMRESLPIFEEDRGRPLFIEEGLPLRGVFETERGAWWWRVDNDSEEIDALLYRWQTLATWIARAAPVLEVRFPTLPRGPLEWRARFDALLASTRADEGVIDLNQARACLTASAEPGGRLLHTHATADYEKAFSVFENIAERALVEALVKATALLVAQVLTQAELDAIVAEIIPGPLARQTHAFRQIGFRDHVRGALQGSATRIELEDDAAARVSVGWLARDRDQGAWVVGKADCRAFLNTLVTRLEEELIGALRTFDRRKMIGALLRNHERAAMEIDDWMRTAAANLALHDDEQAVLRSLGEQESKLTAVAMTCRILLEIAACECPLSGGLTPGKLDLSRLMSRTSQIFHFGGDSDAIHWDAMSPRIRITPFGDVHANRDFVDSIVEPYGRRNADLRFEDAVESYASHFDVPEPAPAEPDESADLDTTFFAAVEETLGAPVRAFRTFIEYLEDLGVRSGQAILFLKPSQLLAVRTDIGALEPDEAKAVIEALTFVATPRWGELPSGYPGVDRHIWRFRRQLSVLRRPLIPVEEGDDPVLAVAPALVRQAWRYLMGNYRRGDFPDGHLKPRLAAWKKKEADRRGKAFAKQVAETLEAVGWTTHLEVKMTKLLKRGLERDYGDVDVLAHHPGSGRVAIIECKNVQYRKTYGEVAEQLADFRGGLNAKGKPDYLLRHLDRMALARANLRAVGAFLGLADLQTVESHLVFRNPVPMTYALKQMESQVTVGVFDDLDLF